VIDLINNYLNSKNQLVKLDKLDLFLIQQNNITGTYIEENEFGTNIGFYIEYFSKEIYAIQFLNWLLKQEENGSAEDFVKWLNKKNSTNYTFKEIFRKDIIEPIEEDFEIDLLNQRFNN